MKKEILKQLKSDYEKLETKPSTDLWDRLELETDKIPHLPAKRSFQWLKYAAVILLLLTVGGLFYFSSNQIEKENIVAKINHSTKPKQLKPEVEIIHSNINQPENNVVASNVNKISETKSEEKIPFVLQSLPSYSDQQVLVKEEEKTVIINSPAKALIITGEINQPEKALIAERKKANYIKADELLLGREFDKTREEYQDEKGKFGVLDATKIKFKSPNSLKILGMTVFSDSSDTK
ncbi:hypothetical protein A0O34_18715 [Chryseobacterium glaciei]|uniref:Uncharacterized protein n=1 Tax=Chryseobacterium glaciei TaxID=1685010 RepID=A0A172Y028_9FLAO|nr:hypothetical protein [Chryseobacterium glaciei]ANF52425.1 hypothetical protein A0O34_18715 [Chryseobacterium glaciei]